jgi:hypothetical protein
LNKDDKSIIDNINKEYSFKNKFFTKIGTSIWDRILFIVLLLFFVLCYPGINNFFKLFLFICKSLNITITKENLSLTMDIFAYFVLIIAGIITVFIIRLLYNILLKIIMKLK